MNKIKSIILDQTNWLELNIENEENIIIYCESFGDSDEYIALLNQRVKEFGVTLEKEHLEMLAKQKANRKAPTKEEIEEAKRIARVNSIPKSISMRQTRLLLLEMGLLDEVEDLVSRDRKSKIEWEYSNDVLRSSDLISTVKETIGLTDEQVDDMFIEASKL